MNDIGLSRTIDVVTLGMCLMALVALLQRRIRVRVRVPGGRGPRASWVTRSVTALGFFMALASPAGATGKRNGSPLPGSHRPPETPWSRTGGLPSPSRPPVGTGAIDPEIGARAGASPPWHPKPTASHPAVHSGGPRSGRITPLFPRHSPGRRRASTDAATAKDRSAERERAMRMHPAGKALPDERLPTLHRVVSGESLWTIAETALGTDDPIRVARYWHKIHRTNREVIGGDPNLLLPGQQLTLPVESA